MHFVSPNFTLSLINSLKPKTLEISLSVTPARGFESHPVRQLQGFCYEQKPCFFMSSLKKFPHGHPARLTAPDNALSDDTFDVASRCEYVFAVVEKSL